MKRGGGELTFSTGNTQLLHLYKEYFFTPSTKGCLIYSLTSSTQGLHHDCKEDAFTVRTNCLGTDCFHSQPDPPPLVMCNIPALWQGLHSWLISQECELPVFALCCDWLSFCPLSFLLYLFSHRLTQTVSLYLKKGGQNRLDVDSPGWTSSHVQVTVKWKWCHGLYIACQAYLFKQYMVHDSYHIVWHFRYTDFIASKLAVWGSGIHNLSFQNETSIMRLLQGQGS